MSGAFCPLKSLITTTRGGWQEPEGHRELGTWLLPHPCPSLAVQCPWGGLNRAVGRGSASSFPPESSRRGQCLHMAAFRAQTWGLGGLQTIQGHIQTPISQRTSDVMIHLHPGTAVLKGTAEW